jgi:prevent-host-death family protein
MSKEHTVTATQFRANLFAYLDKVAAGETIVIQRHNQPVARVVSLNASVDWRTQMTHKVTLLVTPDELLSPLTDVWEAETGE